MKQSDGIFQTKEKTWGYEFSIFVNGKRIARRRITDDDGKPFTTKKAAQKARTRCINAMREETELSVIVNDKSSSKTLRDVYEEYREKGCAGKAYKTLLKQDSIWKNHLGPKYGDMALTSFSTAEINDYLSELYYSKQYSYMYTQSFLKMFYLIFGQAYDRNYLDSNTYNRLCKNSMTRIKMPKKSTSEDDDIAVFSSDEFIIMDEHFRGSNAEMAYLLGKYCGLRINECYGLKWDNVDIEGGKIHIDRQEQYQDGLIKLVPLKTHNARRTIYMCDALKSFFQKYYEDNQKAEKEYYAKRRQNQTIIEDIDGSPLSSLELVNTLPDGKIQTVNSMKYHSRMLKAKGIYFKYHYLRHSYGTRMAELNTPQHLLCNQMGHGKIQTTQKYYIGLSKTGVDILKDNINKL